jgi:hypothetical protein
VIDTFTISGSSQQWLEVGRDTHGYGLTRAVFDFGSLKAIHGQGPEATFGRMGAWGCLPPATSRFAGTSMRPR